MYKHPILDFNQLNNEMISLKIPAYEKLSYIYERMGGDFFDKEKRLIKGSKVALVGIGGLPISIKNDKIFILGNETNLSSIKKELYTTMGFSAGMSYLNPYNKTNNELADKTLSLGHNSIKHTIQLNILLVGISSGVEHEFSSQRDIVHLSRLTVAKTSAQKKPCLILRNPQFVNSYKKIIEETDKITESITDKDWESINLLYPSAKASMVMLSGTLKNIEKLIDLKNSDGKEDEFIESLEKIESLIKWLQ